MDRFLLLRAGETVDGRAEGHRTPAAAGERSCGSDGGLATERRDAFSALKFQNPKIDCVANMTDRFCPVRGSEAVTENAERVGHPSALVDEQKDRAVARRYSTVKSPLLAVVPPGLVTRIGPVVAPWGTVARM